MIASFNCKLDLYKKQKITSDCYVVRAKKEVKKSILAFAYHIINATTIF